MIGAGPGSVGLLSIRAREVLSECDVVVYDNLVNPSVLSLCNPEARKIDVGKRPQHHPIKQERINQILVEEASKGAKVARLKGGDPFVFGRGGEEAEALAQARISFEVIPGISSAIAVPAYAGIPLTHRKCASSFAVITGHEDVTRDESRIPWDQLATGPDTLIFLMGVRNLQTIVDNLLVKGRSPSTPSALIQWGTTPEQVTVVGPLEEIPREAQRKGINPPAVLVVGEVVRYRAVLNWFEGLPLFGKRVVVTRATTQSSRLIKILEDLGARVIPLPTISIEDPQSWESLDKALDELPTYDWCIFTSANGVERFFKRLFERGYDVRRLAGLKLASIGSETEKALWRHGLKADLVPEEYTSEGLIKTMEDVDVSGKAILMPRAAEARDLIPKVLTERGARVEVVEAYRTTLPHDHEIQPGLDVLDKGMTDAITFTSSSTVRNFKRLLDERHSMGSHRGVPLFCIGPVTADTARDLFRGEQIIVSKRSTIDALVESMTEYFQSGPPVS